MQKNITLLVLVLWAGFSLAAQSFRDPYIYVLPVTGTGSRPGDNSFFYRELVFELITQNINLARTQNAADFTLIGTLAPYMDEGLFVFHLDLQDNRTGRITVNGGLTYGTLDEIYDLLPVLVSTMRNRIPGSTSSQAGRQTVRQAGAQEEWRDKRLYFGVSAFWTPRIYIGDDTSTHLVNFGGGLSAELHFLNFLALGAGGEVSGDWVRVSRNAAADNYQNMMLEVPLSLRGVIKPGGYFMIEPYAGAQLNIPFSKNTKPPLVSFMGGLQYGVKAGSGAVFIDARFAMDRGKSTIAASPGGNASTYQRYIVHLGLGYKFGVFQSTSTQSSGNLIR